MKNLEVGKTYKTRGGWEAVVIWKGFKKSNDLYPPHPGYQVIHKPGTEDESSPFWHDAEGKVSECIFGINLAPTYGHWHPADIILKGQK